MERTEADSLREHAIYKVTWVGALVNFLLLIFKFIAGWLGNSAAMLADAIHSLSDFVTDMIVLVFVRIANKPRDKNHDYGHGKYETFATVVIGLLLLVVGFGMLWGGAADVMYVYRGGVLPAPGNVAFVAALVSIVCKEILYRYTYAAGARLQSEAVKANAWHHRSDALSSVGAALGIGGAILLGKGWSVLDPLAAMVVSLLIVRVAWKMLMNCFDELMEHSLPEVVEREILDILLTDEKVSQPHNLCTRRIGSHYAIEVHVRMDGALSLRETHERVTNLEYKLRAKYGSHTHVIIHVEPLK